MHAAHFYLDQILLKMAENNSEEYRIYINRLRPYTTTHEIQQLFGNFGETFNSFCDPCKGFGLISYHNELNAIHAIAATHNRIWLGYPIQVEWARGWPKTRRRVKKYNWVYSSVCWNIVRVLVSELNHNVNEELLQTIFGLFGTIEKIRIFLHLECAVIRFTTKEAATLAICTVDGTKICDTPVRCEWYHGTHEILQTLEHPQLSLNSCNDFILSSGTSSASSSSSMSPSYPSTLPSTSARPSPSDRFFSNLVYDYSKEIENLVSSFNRAVGTSIYSTRKTNSEFGQGAVSDSSAFNTNDIHTASFISKSDKSLQKDEDESKKASNEKTDFLCKICMDKDLSVVFLNCGHLISCVDCSRRLIYCPVCREKIVKKVKAYLS